MKRAAAPYRAGQPGGREGWPLAASALVAANLLAWCAVAWTYGLSPFAVQRSSLLLGAGAANGELVRAGEWWRLITSQFLHVHLPHLIFNMASLFGLGWWLERELGAGRFLLLYFGGGLAGQLAGVAAAPELVSSGASQATSALAGAALVGLWRGPCVSKMKLVVLLFVVALTITLDLVFAGRVKAGHLGGFCAGALIGYALRRPAPGV